VHVTITDMHTRNMFAFSSVHMSSQQIYKMKRKKESTHIYKRKQKNLLSIKNATWKHSKTLVEYSRTSGA
jgi:hypothetical protein